MNDVIDAISDLVTIFDRFGIRYFIGGSIASSLNGIFRSTNDIDVVLENSLSPNVISELGRKFIVDSIKLSKNHSENRAFNIFHENTALKIDLFPAWTEFHFFQLDRALPVVLPNSIFKFKVATAEDTILAKLLWIKKSPSDRQISDIKGVLNINKDTLDMAYLNDWAEKLGLTNELQEIIRG